MKRLERYTLSYVEDYERFINVYGDMWETTYSDVNINIPEHFNTEDDEVIELLLNFIDHDDPRQANDPEILKDALMDESYNYNIGLVKISEDLYNKLLKLDNAEHIFQPIMGDESDEPVITFIGARLEVVQGMKGYELYKQNQLITYKSNRNQTYVKEVIF